MAGPNDNVDQPGGGRAEQAAPSSQEEMLKRLPGAGPPTADEAEGEGDGTLDE